MDKGRLSKEGWPHVCEKSDSSNVHFESHLTSQSPVSKSPYQAELTFVHLCEVPPVLRGSLRGYLNPRRCKTSSVGQSTGLSIPRSSVRFWQPPPQKKTENSILHRFELHRPSDKGTKLLFQVIKAIINQCGVKPRKVSPRKRLHKMRRAGRES